MILLKLIEVDISIAKLLASSFLNYLYIHWLILIFKNLKQCSPVVKGNQTQKPNM